MMECWNNGVLGSVRIVHAWFHPSSIPLFHYSSIPSFRCLNSSAYTGTLVRLMMSEMICLVPAPL